MSVITPTETEVRPFHIDVPEAELVGLRRRTAATRWPDPETVADQSQGVQMATLQDLVHHWGTDYDWWIAEARLNALPQFLTRIDGLDIHFLHVRSPPGAMPLLMTHGWPGSILELLKVIGPLTDPTAHGGRAEDACHVVVPSIPGYGFSGKPQDTSWRPIHLATAWQQLMGIHVNMPGATPPDVALLVKSHQLAPDGFSEAEQRAWAGLDEFYRHGFGYAEMMNSRPQTMGCSLADSPVGMAAFYYEKFATWTHSGGEPEPVLTPDDITLYWLTTTGASSSRSSGTPRRRVAGRSTPWTSRRSPLP